MPPVQSLSNNIINRLKSFGIEKLQKVLDDNCSCENSAELNELQCLLDNEIAAYQPLQVTETRPKSLECDVVRFQNNKEKWVAFVGLLNDYPYEIFTGVLDDEDGIALPKTVSKGHITKNYDEEGNKRYDFSFENRRGYKTTIEGLSERFNKEYWNYAKLISGILRYRMPLTNVIKLVSSLQLENENINTWAIGVARALKRYSTGYDGQEEQEEIG